MTVFLQRNIVHNVEDKASTRSQIITSDSTLCIDLMLKASRCFVIPNDGLCMNRAKLEVQHMVLCKPELHGYNFHKFLGSRAG